MKKLFFSFSVIAAIAGFAACKKSSSSPSNNASVMFVNGCAGTTGITATVGTTQVSNAGNLSFLSNSGYQNVTAGTDSVGFVLTNLGTPLKSGTSTLAANSHYSIFVGGLITAPSYLLLTDDLTAPTSSANAKVRFVNLSNDTLSETAYVGTSTIASGITSQTAGTFAQVAAGSYTIKAGDPSNISTVISTSNPIQINAGKIYTVILTGTTLGTGTSALALTIIGNN